MATFTSSLFANTPKAVHVGTNAIVVNYQHGANTASAGDVIFLAKIPHGARIVEIIEDHSTGSTANGIDIGLASGAPSGGGAHLSLFVAAGAQATKNRLNVLGIPGNVSASDADPNRYGILAAKLTVSGTATLSLMLNVTALYTADGVT